MPTVTQEPTPTPNKMRTDLMAQVSTISDNDANAVLIVRQKDGRINVNGYNLSTLLTVSLMAEAEVMVIKNYLIPPDQLLPIPKSTPAPAPVPAPDTQGWVACGKENETCKLPGEVEVRYGADGKYATKVCKDSVVCSNDVFGDPAVGSVKSCWYRPLTSATSKPGTTTTAKTGTAKK